MFRKCYAAVAAIAAAPAVETVFDLKDICFSRLLVIPCLTTISTARVLKRAKEYRNEYRNCSTFQRIISKWPKMRNRVKPNINTLGLISNIYQNFSHSKWSASRLRVGTQHPQIKHENGHKKRTN